VNKIDSTHDPVIETGASAWMKYAIGMALAVLPLFLLKDDPHWLNIIAFTYFYSIKH
jgi:hypothetical protein